MTFAIKIKWPMVKKSRSTLLLEVLKTCWSFCIVCPHQMFHIFSFWTAIFVHRHRLNQVFQARLFQVPNLKMGILCGSTMASSLLKTTIDERRLLVTRLDKIGMFIYLKLGRWWKEWHKWANIDSPRAAQTNTTYNGTCERVRKAGTRPAGSFFSIYSHLFIGDVDETEESTKAFTCNWKLDMPLLYTLDKKIWKLTIHQEKEKMVNPLPCYLIDEPVEWHFFILKRNKVLLVLYDLFITFAMQGDTLICIHIYNENNKAYIAQQNFVV